MRENRTSEHIPSLLIQDYSSRLQVLRFEEIGDGKRFRFRRTRLNGLLLSLLLLLLRSHLGLVLRHSLSLELFDIFGDSKTMLFCFSSELALHLSNLLRGRRCRPRRTLELDLWLFRLF